LYGKRHASSDKAARILSRPLASRSAGFPRNDRRRLLRFGFDVGECSVALLAAARGELGMENEPRHGSGDGALRVDLIPSIAPGALIATFPLKYVSS